MNATATTTPVEVEYYLTPSTLELAEKAIEKANRRAVRVGLGGYTYHTTTKVVSEVGPDGIASDRKYVVLTLIGERPAIGDWTFVATLNTTPGGQVIVNTVPGVDLDAADYRARPGECDHCHKTRRRNATYLLLNTATGETQQVGSGCIELYTGIPAQMPRTWFSAREDLDAELGGMRGGGAAIAPVLDVLAMTIVEVDQHGYTSSTRASEYGGQATGQAIRDAVFPYNAADREFGFKLAAQVTDEVKARAAAIGEWATRQAGSNYAANLAAIASEEWVDEKHVPLLASAVASYRREMGYIAEQAAREAGKLADAANSTWQGQPKERITRTLTVRSTMDMGGQYYGPRYTTTTLVKFVDTDGNLYTWWARDLDDEDTPETGQTFTAVGTVKEHKEYQGTKQTVLIRVKLTPAEK